MKYKLCGGCGAGYDGENCPVCYPPAPVKTIPVKEAVPRTVSEVLARKFMQNFESR